MTEPYVIQHERDLFALKLYRFNEYVRKVHPHTNIRFTIYKEVDTDPVYALKINGVEYFYYDYPAFSYDSVYKIRSMTNEYIYREITSHPLPEW
jgi:hypothetical protein